MFLKTLKNICLEIYWLELTKFLSVPRSAWQAAVKKIEAKLELLTGIDMLLMVEKGIRGGIITLLMNMLKLVINIRKITIKIKISYKNHILNIEP